MIQSSFFDGKSIAITGGTGSFGTAFSKYLINKTAIERLVILSRDWHKQKRLRSVLNEDSRLRMFIGDVRDRERLNKAFRNVDIVIHAAAIKDIVIGQYNPEEVIKTNVFGSANVFDAAIKCGADRVFAISSDKACAPLNIYGSSKQIMEHMAINWNAYSNKTKFSCGRWGNVLGSSSSVLPLFKKQAKKGVITLTDYQATRFWIKMDGAISFVARSISEMKEGLIYIPKLRSSYVYDLAQVIAPNATVEEIGLRPGEKLHEVMISREESRNAMDIDWAYVIHPPSYEHDFGDKAYRYKGNGEEYSSFNAEKYTQEELAELIQ